MIGDKVISQKCAFIIVTYNSKDDIKECVLSIKTYHPECGIYLIDNNSTDGTKELIQTIENINLTILQVNSGFAGGSNLGIKKALRDNYEYFFLFNPDARIYKKTINSLINLSKTKKGLVGPIIKDFYSGEIQSIGGKFYPIFSYFRIIKKHNNLIKNYVKIDWILGAALLISKEIINKCGYLDENFFPATFEDSSYCIEARKKGFLSFIDLDSSIKHKGGTSSGGDQKYLLRIIKNKFYYALTYQNTLFFITTNIENSLRLIYHKFFGILKGKNKK